MRWVQSMAAANSKGNSSLSQVVILTWAAARFPETPLPIPILIMVMQMHWEGQFSHRQILLPVLMISRCR